MKSTRRRVEAALAVLFAVVMLLVGGRALWVRSRKPIYEDAAAVPSTAAAARSDRYAGAVEDSRQLARALAADDNLPGLSVAVAIDGEIVWAEGSAGRTWRAASRSRRARASVSAPSRNR